MEHLHPYPAAEQQRKVHELNQAILFCYDASSQKIPVGIFKDFEFEDDYTCTFSSNYFPVTETLWDSFAAELHFYKKDVPGSFVMMGIVFVDPLRPGKIVFKIDKQEIETDVEEQPFNLWNFLYKPYQSLYKKSADIIMYPFRKKAPAQVMH